MDESEKQACEVCGTTDCNGHTKQEQIERLQADNARLKAALENHRSCSCDIGGCYPNYQHIECDNCKVVKQALEAHSPVGNADASAPPDMSMKQEKSDMLAGPVDAGDTSASCSETAGTEPTCAPSHHNLSNISRDKPTPEQVRRLEDVARAAEKAMNSEVVKRAPFAGYSESLANLREALARLKDSGWRG